MKYTIKDNGDLLEKTNFEFIQTCFPTYEKVWQIFIGNIGNDTKATIPGYPQEREEFRQAFSEHTYTILQSIILLHRLLNKNVFVGPAETLEDKMTLQENILLFYSHVGRIRDNLVNGARCLIGMDIKLLENQLDEFYHKRHIPVHGRIVPIIFKRNGEVEIPVFSKNDEDPTGWDHKRNNWPDILHMPSESINTSLQQLFWELIGITVDVFGRFHENIFAELNSKGLELHFEYSSGQSGISGYSQQNRKSIYGIPDTDGKHGSSGYGGDK